MVFSPPASCPVLFAQKKKERRDKKQRAVEKETQRRRSAHTSSSSSKGKKKSDLKRRYEAVGAQHARVQRERGDERVPASNRRDENRNERERI